MPIRLLLTAMVALAAGTAAAQSIQGTATVRDNLTLPPGAVFEATLEDVSRLDAPAAVVAGTRIAVPSTLPIRFTITYDPARINARGKYVVRARIVVSNRTAFTTDTATPVITQGNPTTVAVEMRSVGRATGAAAAPAAPPTVAPASPAAELVGTAWQLVGFQGSDGTTRTPDDRTRYTIEFAADGRLLTRVDCNRGSGSWTSSGPGQLEFGPLALTRAMCPPDSLHDQIVKHWSLVRSYVIRDGHLFVSLRADGGVYEWTRRN